MRNSFFSKMEINNLGVKNIGNNCLISRFANFYNPELIEIGNNVRIDDFCILSGKIKIGSYVHVSAYSAFYGSKGIEIDSFSGLSPRTTIFSAIDDFSGDSLINPMVPDQFRRVTGGLVRIEKYVQLGANTIVMPNLKIAEGAVTGAFTLVNRTLKKWKIYIGVPAKVLKDRKTYLIQYAEKIQK